MSDRCYTIDVDGEPATGRFTRPPTEADLDAFRDLIRHLRNRTEQLLPPERVAAEEQALQRIRDRNAALFEERP